MKKYWFRICFERECEDKREAEKICDDMTDEFWDSSTMSSLSTTIEETK